MNKIDYEKVLERLKDIRHMTEAQGLVIDYSYVELALDQAKNERLHNELQEIVQAVEKLTIRKQTTMAGDGKYELVLGTRTDKAIQELGNILAMRKNK